MQLTDLNFKEWRHEIQKSNYEQTNFYDIGKIFSANNVIRLYEDLSQSTFSDWIVLCIELVESVESVAILESQSKARAEKHHLFVKMHHCVNLLNKKLFPQEAAFSQNSFKWETHSSRQSLVVIGPIFSKLWKAGTSDISDSDQDI